MTYFRIAKHFWNKTRFHLRYRIKFRSHLAGDFTYLRRRILRNIVLNFLRLRRGLGYKGWKDGTRSCLNKVKGLVICLDSGSHVCVIGAWLMTSRNVNIAISSRLLENGGINLRWNIYLGWYIPNRQRKCALKNPLRYLFSFPLYFQPDVLFSFFSSWRRLRWVNLLQSAQTRHQSKTLTVISIATMRRRQVMNLNCIILVMIFRGR